MQWWRFSGEIRFKVLSCSEILYGRIAALSFSGTPSSICGPLNYFKLNKIKNIALFSIKHKILDSLCFDDIIDEFISLKNRKGVIASSSSASSTRYDYDLFGISRYDIFTNSNPRKGPHFKYFQVFFVYSFNISFHMLPNKYYYKMNKY